MFKKVDHIEVVPTDLERTLKFYTDVLEFKIQRRIKSEGATAREVVFLELSGGSMIHLISTQNPAPLLAEPWRVGYRRMALEVEDIDKAIDYLNKKGILVSRPPSSSSAKMVEIEDPDGIPIEIRQWA